MRTLPLLLCFCLALLITHIRFSNASAQPDAPAAKQQPNISANDHRVAEYLLDRMKAVEEAIGKSVAPNLAMQIANCSEQAAHTSDPGKVGDGLDFSKIDANKAINSCKEAYNNGGSNIGLVLASLSRAYNKAEDYTLSFLYAKKAAESGYPFGDVMMAIHYQYGDGVEKNIKEQFRWYKKAAAKGVTAAMGVTSSNYLKGEGTSVNIDEAYFWAFSAVESHDPNGFYHLAKVLEKSAESRGDPNKLLQLAKQSFEVAKANYINVENDIARVNQKLSPNHIADDKVLFSRTIKGRKIEGILFPTESSSNWYLGAEPLANQGNTYFYARTSYHSSIFTLWYKHGASPKSSGWFIDFFYAGSNDIKAFSGASVLSKLKEKTNYINLDLADPKVQALPGTYRLTGRISYRDVLLLQNAEQVKFYYVTSDKRTPTYTMNLNDTESTASAAESAQSVLTKLTNLVSQSDDTCCTQPNIVPLSQLYRNIHSSCEDRDLDYIFQKQVKQDCHIILKTANQSAGYYTDPMKTNLTRLLKAIDAAMSETP